MRKGFYFKSLENYCKYLYNSTDTRKSYSRFINGFSIEDLTKMMVDENKKRFNRRAKAGKDSVKNAIESGNHVSKKLNIEAIERYESILENLKDVFINKDIINILIKNKIEAHNANAYKKHLIKIKKIKSVYKPKHANEINVEIFQKIDENGNCCKLKLQAYKKSNKLESAQSKKADNIMKPIINELPNIFTYNEVEHILKKHGKGPSYIKNIISRNPDIFKFIGEVPAKKVKGRGGNKPQKLWKKTIKN